ncbi:MAG: hypothetical protein M3327_06010 [Actinomycetota bacterium]|nr:hypothetical protein [Actinomycetota bacterium]
MVRVACCQITPEVGDAEGNRRRARAAVREAVDAGARLVVLPELCTSGYVFESEEEARALAQAADGGALRDWGEEAAQGDAVVVGGFAEAGDDGLLYNSAAVVDATGPVAIYRKLHLWDREKLVFEPGSEPAPVVETRVGRVGVAVCYDLYFPELVRGLALAGADVVALPTNSPRLPRPDGEPPIEITIAAAQAHLNRVFFAVCDRAGRERGVDWVGGSVVCDENGWVLAGPPDGFGPGLVLADCEFERARDKAWGEGNDVFGDRRPEVYPLGNPTAVA